MERAMSVEDKIRRAEEIYYKRREQEIPKREIVKKSQKEKKNIKLLKKMIKQIMICLLIYGVFYLIVNNNYIFSEDFTNKVKEILAQDINFSQIYSAISNKISQMYNKLNKSEQQGNEQNEDWRSEIRRIRSRCIGAGGRMGSRKNRRNRRMV